MKKITFYLLLALISILSIDAVIPTKKVEEGLVHWISFEEAVKKTKKEPRPILVDVYTQWCGPCKMMTKNTFNHPQIAEYLNKNFYNVKFDAETFDTVKFLGTQYDTIIDNKGTKALHETEKYVYFVNTNIKGTPRAAHQFAYSILDGKLQYPSLVFLSPKIQRLDIRAGYHLPAQFEPIIKFYGSGSYTSKTYDDFLKTFESDLK